MKSAQLEVPEEKQRLGLVGTGSRAEAAYSRTTRIFSAIPSAVVLRLKVATIVMGSVLSPLPVPTPLQSASLMRYCPEGAPHVPVQAEQVVEELMVVQQFCSVCSVVAANMAQWLSAMLTVKDVNHVGQVELVVPVEFVVARVLLSGL